MIVDEIAKKISDFTSDDNTIIQMVNERMYSLLHQSSGINFVVSELDQLAGLPLRVRQIQYQSVIEGVKSANKSTLDSYISNVIQCASECLAKKIGDDESKNWGRELYLKISMILAGRGHVGIFSGENAIARITFEEENSQFLEHLEFRFNFEWVKIAERRMKSGEHGNNWDGFQTIPTNHISYDKLLSSLKILKSAEFDSSDKYHHLFVWSDIGFDKFQKSLVDNVVNDYVKNVSPHQHTARVLLFISTNSNYEGARKDFTEREQIALKRCFNNGEIILAPGSGEDVFLDEIMNLSGPKAILNDKRFTKSISERFNDLRLDKFRLISGLNSSIHEGTIDLNEISTFVISSNCWTGTWSESKEVDGEQVIS